MKFHYQSSFISLGNWSCQPLFPRYFFPCSLCVQAKENRKSCWAPLSGLGWNNAVLASAKSPGLHLQLSVTNQKGYLKNSSAIVQIQNTELHNALPAPSPPSSLPAKYIKGGSAWSPVPQSREQFFHLYCNVDDNITFIFAVMSLC